MASAAAGGAVGAFVVSAAAREEAVRRGEARSALCHACRRAIDAGQEAFWCACRLRAERPPEEDGGLWIWFCRGCHCGEAQACAVCEAQDADGGGGAALEALVRRSEQLHADFVREAAAALKRAETLQRECADSLAAQRAELGAQVAAHRARVQRWDETARRLRATHLPDVVRLSVGGTVFATSTENLRRFPESYFGALFSGRWPAQQSADGTYFIDRDPACFAIIVNHLRGEDVAPTIAALPPLLRAQLARDADFYMLDGLIEKSWTSAAAAGAAAWECKAACVTLSGPGQARSALTFAPGGKWTIKVKGAGHCGNLFIGVELAAQQPQQPVYYGQGHHNNGQFAAGTVVGLNVGTKQYSACVGLASGAVALPGWMAHGGELDISFAVEGQIVVLQFLELGLKFNLGYIPAGGSAVRAVVTWDGQRQQHGAPGARAAEGPIMVELVVR
jgi:hypothetical protein